MLLTSIHPRFCDTDALGHINHTVIPVWFLEAREPVYRWFSPDSLTANDVAVAVVRLEVDYLAETRFGADAEVRGHLAHIGHSSFKLLQELWQDGQLTARGLTTLVHLDRETRRSKPLSEAIRKTMSEHLLSEEGSK